jgi:RNA polymerase sigma-70 factor (ECF subfamily)
MTPSQNSHQHFATTHWSMVMQLGAPRVEDARAALVKLCLRYWYPIYAYLRQCGHSPAIANDITRSFLQHLLQHFQDEGTTRAQGQFRRYLLARLHDFLVGEWSNVGARDTAPEFAEAPPDLESRNARDNAGAESPEQAYQKSFALELIARAFARLRQEAIDTGHAEMYEALECYIAEEPPAGQYEELAQHLRARPLALVVALKRLRQRFRELIDLELADTVSSAEEMLAEQEALYDVLSRIE